MKKTILTGAMLALSSFCWGTDIHSDNFKELCNIYAAATRALNEMHSAADWEQTQKVLAELQKKCQNDPSLQAVLQLTYPTCPKELKDSYEGALKEQFEMKDAVKRLSMAGTLQAENISTTINGFVKAVYLQELVYDERRGNEGAPYETKEQRDARMKWWRDGKFGMFIHYGLYSGLAGEFQGKNMKDVWNGFRCSLALILILIRKKLFPASIHRAVWLNNGSNWPRKQAVPTLY